MNAEQERFDQQKQIDAEVAVSAAALHAHQLHEQSPDRREPPSINRPVSADPKIFQRYRAVTEALREEHLGARERHLAALERAAQQREASNVLRGELLDARERAVTVREQVADQRDIDAELASWPDAGPRLR